MQEVCNDLLPKGDRCRGFDSPVVSLVMKQQVKYLLVSQISAVGRSILRPEQLDDAEDNLLNIILSVSSNNSG